MPAFAIVTRPCSITSWMAVRSISDILSNSSMQTTPRSARTMAPASRRRSPGNRRGKCTWHGLSQRTEKNPGLSFSEAPVTTMRKNTVKSLSCGTSQETRQCYFSAPPCRTLPHRSLSAALASLISLRDSQPKLLYCSSSLSPNFIFTFFLNCFPLCHHSSHLLEDTFSNRDLQPSITDPLCQHTQSYNTSLSFQIVPAQASAHSQPGESAHTHAGPQPGSLMPLPVSWSVVTAAVRPTPDEPRPVVGMALGAVQSTYRRSWDLATEGSPTEQGSGEP